MKEYDQIAASTLETGQVIQLLVIHTCPSSSKKGKYSKFSLPNEQLLDLEDLLGRMTSASYMPSPSDGNRFALLREDVARLFKTYEKLGKVRMLYDPNVLGKILS